MKFKNLLYSAIILVIALAACNPVQEIAPATPTTAEPAPQETMETIENPQPQAEVTDSAETSPPEESQATQPQDVSACYHPYFPIEDGAYWTYQQPAEGNYTLRIEETGQDTFRMLQEMESEDIIFTVDWYCSDDGLLRGTFGQMDLLGNTPDGEENPEFQLETFEWEGETLPSPELIEVGYAWTSEYKLSADYDIEGFSGSMQVIVEIQHQINTFEEVVVPAGSFTEAMRVDSTGTIEMVMVMGEDNTTPFSNFEFNFSTWYVEGIGMVKSSETMSGFASSTELVETSFLE
jgi:hypothetical protein